MSKIIFNAKLELETKKDIHRRFGLWRDGDNTKTWDDFFIYLTGLYDAKSGDYETERIG